ncbi:MAG: ArsC family reductase [Micavibrio sp.]|nr:ArsC family reductase [Micavibrio sp.]|tara:strand:- start:645 stop:989 length:345 start_codon:yes stop_codon:yes gene_type:complete
MTTKLYGIKNCDTMKKAMKWLDDHHVDYSLHNYKKDGIDDAVLKQAIEEHGWETVINRNGTTWRALPDDVKNTMTKDSAIALAHENPSVIKRPLLLRLGQTFIGFKPKEYEELF